MTKRRILLILHWIIIINFALEIFYGAYQTFSVGDTAMPLFGQANAYSYEEMVTRRLYAIETWIAIAGLSIYLALTEMRHLWRQPVDSQ